MYDIVIKNGKIIDGTKNPWYISDIGIKNGKIAKIGVNLTGEKEIDATHLVVCPGFIDMHSHTDYILPFCTSMESFVRQGITTCVTGMCGASLAPIHPEKTDVFREILSHFIPFFKDFEFGWYTFTEYLNEMEKLEIPANVAFCVGYENVRICGGAGFDNRLPTAKELETMRRYVEEAMKAGAFGMSTGLIYAPQVFAKTEEIIELAKVVAAYDGLYFSHIRGEGGTVLEAVAEFIDIVEKSGCRGGQIAHLKASGKPVWGSSTKVLQAIEKANNKGISITCDAYPYDRGLTTLMTALPPWAQEGGPEKIISRLKDFATREKIKKEIIKTPGKEGWENWININGFDRLYISLANTDKWKGVRGKNISEIAKIKGMDEWEVFFELLIDEELGVFITLASMDEKDITRIMTSKYHMVGTDGTAIPNDPSLGAFHPRFYGTYPRILGRYVRDKKVLTLEDAVRRMTSFPAQRLGLQDRGLLKEHMWADIVVFDPETISDTATYEDPHQFPKGIHYVLVNGSIVVAHNSQTDLRPGAVLRH